MTTETKKAVWPGFDIDVSSLAAEDATSEEHKKIPARFRGRLLAYHFSRKRQLCQQVIKHICASLVFDLTAGVGRWSEASIWNEGTVEVPTVNVVNSEEHREYILTLLERHALTAMTTPGHRWHNEMVQDDIKKLFPMLIHDATRSPGDEDIGEVDGAVDGIMHVFDDDE